MLLELGEHRIEATRRTIVMGILNVSLDSTIAASIVPREGALARAIALRDAGAEVIDVGAQSTRTGAVALTPQQEIDRVAPAIEAIAREGIPTSVDTWSSEVARAAAEAGAALLNDVSGLADPAMASVAAEHGLSVCVMHMRGAPQHHRQADQRYDNVQSEVRAFLEERMRTLDAAGVRQVWLDPGFAFGKSMEDNVRLLRWLPELVALGRPVLISASRKGFLGELLGAGDTQSAPRLLEATLAFNVLAASMGVHIVRVHDVAEVGAALRVVNELRRLTEA